MKLTLRRLVALGSALAALVLVALGLLWLWPTATPSTAPPADAEPVAAMKPPVDGGTVPVDILEDRKQGDVLERLGIDPEITPNCAVINQWHDRAVPGWVIQDNMDAAGMVFHEFELECLTTSPLPPSVLTWAENHIDHNTNNLLAEREQ